MQIKTFDENKKTYLQYNNFRKQIFADLAPADSEVILYMLPWMLGCNDPAVPGYVAAMASGFEVCGADSDEKIRKRIDDFLKRLKMAQAPAAPAAGIERPQIHGIYTIGSIGTISQSAQSDCDIWICVDRQALGEKAFGWLIEKTNLIKGWLDNSIRIPVYFFLCDIDDIRQSNFGSVGGESAGSTQKNTLKEEFYRTAILIAGKIPLWWLCFDKTTDVDYAALVALHREEGLGRKDCIDLGPLESVQSEEYFGAALWQFGKALTNPLKSILKMLLLEMLLAAPRNDLLCHQFRNFILGREKDLDLMDPSMFTMEAVLHHNFHQRPGDLDFIKKCFYLRYELRLYQKMTMKEILARILFERYPLSRTTIDELNSFSEWPFQAQTEFGRKIFSLLAGVYGSISRIEQGVAGSVNPQDMTIIGRKLSVCLEKKPHKIAFCYKPMRRMHLPGLTFACDHQRIWSVSAKGAATIVSNPDIVYCLAYLIWNGLYEPYLVSMTPNATSVTLQEIASLADTIGRIFGAYEQSDIALEPFLAPERIVHMLIVVSAQGHRQNKDENEFSVLYSNAWGEIFSLSFHSPQALREFIRAGGDKFQNTQTHTYVQRNCLYYEKIIERTKTLVARSLAGL